MKSITQIQLFGQVEGILTTVEDAAFPLTFAVSDVRDISKRTGSFSKSITIPDTKENNRLLNFYYDVNIQAGTFNINIQQECAIIQNGVTILDNMIMQLISVNKAQTNNNYEEKVTYTVLIKDNTGDFFSQIGSKKLSDLSGFSGMVGSLTFDTVINSTRNTYLNGWKFLQSALTKEKQYNGLPYIELTEFQPGIFAKTYFDRIFSDVGYSYEWSTQFNNDVHFDKLIIPYNGDKPKTTEVEANAFLVSLSNPNLVTLTNKTIKKSQNGYSFPSTVSLDSSDITRMSFPIEIQDLQNLYSTVTNFYTTPNIPSNNKLTFEFEVDYQVYVTNGNAFPVSAFTHNVVLPGAPQLQIQPRFIIRQNAKDLVTQPLTTIMVANNTRFNNGNTTIASGTTSTPFTTDGILPNAAIDFFIQLGCEPSQTSGLWISNFYNRTSNVTTGASPNCTVNYRITGKRLVIRALEETEYGYNVPIFLHNFIPKNVQQNSFLSSIFQMYNLYAEIDKTNPKKLILKHRDDYYDEGITTDWTFKLDKSRPQDLKFLPELQNKKLLLTYKLDNDEPNQTYFNATGEIFGQSEFTFDNEYTKGVNKKELIFSPTPSFNQYGMVLPLFNGSEPKNNIRILYDGGVRSSPPYLVINYRTGEQDGQWNALSGSGYNYYGHWDSPVNPTFDLNFGICDFYFRTDDYGNHTANNLYNLFWRRTLNQINTGKMLTAHIQLDEADIQKLKLNDKIRVDNSWWNINRIIDYDANSDDSTKVELLSIDDELKLTPFLTRPVVLQNTGSIRIRRPIQWWNQNGLLNPPRNNNLTDWLIPNYGFNNWIVQPSRYGSIYGDNNYLANNGFILGENNYSSGKKAFIVGDGNTISGDNLNNVMIIGNGINAVSANTVYTDNIVISSGSTLNGVAVGQEVLRGLAMVLSTGAYTFSGITVTSPSTFSVGRAQGYIVDSLDPFNVTITEAIYSGQTGLTTPFISATTATYIMLNTGNTLTLLGTVPTLEQRRQNIFLGSIGHPTGTLTGVGNRLDFSLGALSQVRDMFNPIKYINEDVTAFPYTGMSFANTSGRLYGLGIGYITNGSLNPSSLFIAPNSPVTFQYRTQSGGSFSNTTQISANTYDVGGVLTTIPAIPNNSTNQRIYLLENGAIRIQFGQQVYPTLAEAILAAGNEAFTTFSNNRDLGILIGILSLKRGTTDLNTTADARFLAVTKFGESFAAGAGSATGNLQTAYNNSAQPQIITTSALGGLQFRGNGVNTNRVLELQNSAGTTTTLFTNNGGLSATTVSAVTLNIGSVVAGVSINNLGIDATGRVIIGTASSGSSSGGSSTFTGGTITGATRFTNGLTANTFSSSSIVTSSISATTYQNLPYWTGGTGLDSIVHIGSGNLAGGQYAVAEGSTTVANGNAGSHSEGQNTLAQGESAHAEGRFTEATGDWSHAEGSFSKATVGSSHAEGNTTEANNFNAHAEGSLTKANGINSHAEGESTVAQGGASHAEGAACNAIGDFTHAEGYQCNANGTYSHAECYQNTVNSQYSHAEGALCTIGGDYSHTEGINNQSNGGASHCEGANSFANGTFSHCEGLGSTTGGDSSHAEGNGTTASGNYSHSEGDTTQATFIAAHAEGAGTLASGAYSHAEGYQTIAQGNASHSEGISTQALGVGSHAEGNFTIANVDYAHAEGDNTNADGIASHSEGANCTSTGNWSHAEGAGCVAFADYSHAEGFATTATGLKSHSEGHQTEAVADNTHAEGANTFANGTSSHAGGEGAMTKNIGEFARSSKGKNVAGFGQYGIVDYHGDTTDATPTEILIGGIERLIIEDDSTYRYELRVLIRRSTGEAKEILSPVLITNVGGTTTFIGNPNLTKTTQFQSAALSTATINHIADDGLDALVLQMVGVAGITLQWTIKLDYVKIS